MSVTARLSPGRHAEVLLDEVAGDCQRQQGDEKDGRNVADDAQGGDAQQGGAGEALQRGGDVLVDGVGVGGEPVEDAAQRGGLEQPGGGGEVLWFQSVYLSLSHCNFHSFALFNHIIFAPQAAKLTLLVLPSHP